MLENDKSANKNKYRCWINEEDRILSFHYIEGFVLKEFDSFSEFQEYYYKKTYWGFSVQ